MRILDLWKCNSQAQKYLFVDMRQSTTIHEVFVTLLMKDNTSCVWLFVKFVKVSLDFFQNLPNYVE